MGWNDHFHILCHFLAAHLDWMTCSVLVPLYAKCGCWSRDYLFFCGSHSAQPASGVNRESVGGDSNTWVIQGPQRRVWKSHRLIHCRQKKTGGSWHLWGLSVSHPCFQLAKKYRLLNQPQEWIEALFCRILFIWKMYSHSVSPGSLLLWRKHVGELIQWRASGNVRV